MKVTINVKIMLILLAAVILSCTREKEIHERPITNELPEAIENVNVILENSGSMAGYLNGTQFRKALTDFIAELDKVKKDTLSGVAIKNLSFFTFSDNLKRNRFSGSPYDFINKINNKSLAIGKNSPLDDFIKLMVDSADGSSVDLLVTDLVIDKKDKNIWDIIQSGFSLIFNNAKSKGLAVTIYRATSDFNGTYFPVIGTSKKVTSIVRPYFYVLIGPVKKLSALREGLLKSNVFKPENEISFGLNMDPRNIEVLPLSNRTGNWRFKKGEFVKAELLKDKLKFTIAFNLSNLPKDVQDSSFLNSHFDFDSPGINVQSYKVYDKTNFSRYVHRKEKKQLKENTHFLEVVVDQINSSISTLNISLLKQPHDWYESLSTVNDSFLDNGNNLKTFALTYIISGIANAYGDLNSESNYFKLNYKINQ